MNVNDRFFTGWAALPYNHTFECNTCGALVNDHSIELHNDWHNEMEKSK